MTFAEAISTCFSKYATFSGRALRSEYWWFALFNIIVSVVLNLLVQAIGPESAVLNLLAIVVGLGLFLPGLAVSVRRLHDIDKSGWWLLVGLIPLIGIILMVIWFCTKGSVGENRFGHPVGA